MTPALSATPSLPDKVLAIHEALAGAKIPHAIGGALALAYYAEPRATVDIDLNLFVPVERWEKVVDALVAIGVDASELDPGSLARDGQCRLWWDDNPVDLFFANSPIHAEMPNEIRRVPFAGATVPILGPEHLAVCKAMFDRPKDWLDIEQMLLGADGLDAGEIERWLIGMVGDDDRRLRRLRTLRPPS
ncbi:MAG TPA: hypothetical protein VG898_02020 [Solirubrobacterales bacterium]|nr:hypothetical protein [Solirubrobacterales bacterium]